MPRAYSIHPTEMNKLDRLIGAALVQRELAQRLLSHDPSVAREFGLMDSTWTCLTHIAAATLQDLCQEVMALRAGKTLIIDTEVPLHR